LKQQAAEFVGLQHQLDLAHARLRSHAELVSEHEEHRLQMIEVTAKLATAQAEIKELSAHLAEARLRAKSTAKQPAAGGAPGAAPNTELEVIPPDLIATDPALRSALIMLRRTFHDYLRQPSDFSLLNTLHNHAQHLADRGRECGQMIVQRVASVLSALTGQLFEVPEEATPPTMRAVGQSVEFIATLLREQDLDQRITLRDVRAFAVDDDSGVLEAVCESLRAASLDTTTTDSAGAALAELAVNPYDLIILDVNLPELDGLELCSHLRAMDLHKTTPVIFITGHASLENRVQFSLRGGNELLIKPFNLLELALRSLTQIIKAKLQAARAS
jgi:CheY-like chemotaxis protein